MTQMSLQRVLSLLAGVVIVRVTAAIVLNYRNYFPPHFESEFLHGRDIYFFGSYRWAFYPHLVSGPISLILGLIGVSEQFRLRFPRWHRRIGRVQALVVLFVVAPSGLWMAWRAVGGPLAVAGFSLLALLTGGTVALGWRAALQRRFAAHRRWMWRCFLLLCSAVVLRLVVGLAIVTQVQSIWLEPTLAWASWLLPLAGYELITRAPLRRVQTPPIHSSGQ